MAEEGLEMGWHRLTPKWLVQVQALWDEGVLVPQVSEQAGVLGTTLHKAIRANSVP
jgi:hypothetical protein